ncbi:glycosyltransferase family 2 protein [Clostridium fungisolvens]|uniref:Glycosyltransferase 2-like domain-containing protein n=1 Tax=Clostridium fungisolvens TaxID=1604897 RepID=A0A6V8SGH3_9CLOT|nr:glycosyltransferase family A protein [Clostridium fungisolvens]GFP73973.1 hypothetical protein bsdtw1_00009 [Clostridium fungisolvens]
MKKDITVFTPTFNRAELLPSLYDSLIRQNHKNFQWIIYDDGSTDNTEEIINEFKKQSLIDIDYIKSENRGKHVAINNGIEAAKGELFFVVDSDDILTEDAIEIVVDTWRSIPTNEKSKFAGVGALKAGLNNETITKGFNDRWIDATHIDFAFNMGHNQDKAEIYVTELFKKYKYPVFDGEKFMTEAVVGLKIADEGYKMRWVNKAIYLCEYREDGLTQNSFNIRLKNLKGTCYAYNLLSSYGLPPKTVIRYKANYFRFGFHKGLKTIDLKRELLDKKYWLVSSTLGLLLYKKDLNK